MQFGINKLEFIFFKTTKIARARRASTICGLSPIVIFLQLTSAYLFQIVREKSWDYVLILYMKKYEIAYRNYAKAKRTHQVQK